MHIPPYYKRESWQRFFSGVFIGAIMAFVLFLYIYGQFYEKWVEENMELHAQIAELDRQKEALLENQKDIDEKTKEKVTVQTIDVEVENGKELRLDRLIVHQLEENIKEEIRDVVGKDIVSLSENDYFLVSTIENKTYRIDDITYRATVSKLIIAPEIKLTIKLHFSN
ncbi:sporulation membrane protein YtrI [Sediminibacillus massiliensis]|uniref:sporulation membrane protein YtrI n=1 Tax=Sediminibacillus massiliensis TaxID=1926277 RepID=UPI0009887117|nr:sporulation membrane protein YtrI [Sediminibacillus massiliensis]